MLRWWCKLFGHRAHWFFDSPEPGVVSEYYGCDVCGTYTDFLDLEEETCL